VTDVRDVLNCDYFIALVDRDTFRIWVARVGSAEIQLVAITRVEDCPLGFWPVVQSHHLYVSDYLALVAVVFAFLVGRIH